MALSTVIEVRYFGTSKVKVGDRVRNLNAPLDLDENGQLGFDMSGLREKICRMFNLPSGADITLVYIDQDGDVVTLVDDDDLRDVMRQHLKSLRIDVLMNDDNDCEKSSAKRSAEVIMDPVSSVGCSHGSCDDNKENNKAAPVNEMSSCSSSEFLFIADYPVDPTVVNFERNYHSGSVDSMIFHTCVSCDGCGCNPITGSRFMSMMNEDCNLSGICVACLGQCELSTNIEW